MRLAQGQDATDMTLARPSESAQASEDDASAAPERQEAEVDPDAVAERVYELMRQDLRTSIERRA